MDAKFKGADLRGADFTGADLTNARFRDADLRKADLRGADLTGIWIFNTLGACGNRAVFSTGTFYYNWSRLCICLFRFYDVATTNLRDFYDA